VKFDPLGVKRAAKAGAFVFGFLAEPFKRLRQRRRRKRRLRELGIPEEGGMALDLGTRTSTNTVVGTSLVGSIAVQLIQLLPYPELVAALTTPEAVILWGSVIAWVVARFSKTPAVPGKI
jgi:hypothetical protein